MRRGKRESDSKKRLLYFKRSLYCKGLRQCSPKRSRRIELTKEDDFSKDVSRRKENITHFEKN